MAVERSKNRLKARREELEFTQRDLADLAGVTIGTISGLENDGQSPNLKTARAIAEALGTSVDDLFVPEASTAALEDLDAPARRTQPAAATSVPQQDTERTVDAGDAGATTK